MNDSLGHIAGDEMIGIIAGRLHESMRGGDTVARMGGDEFVIISSILPSAEAAVSIMSKAASRMIERVSQPLTLQGVEIRTSCSVGIALYPRDGVSSDVLLKSADSAMYHAKSQGRGTFQFFSDQLNEQSMALMSLSSDIKRGLEEDEFELHYQPKVDLKSNEIVGAEALIRWQHPERGMVSPGEFIEVAERMGLICAIGDWTLHEACRQIKAWEEAGMVPPRVSVNMSAIQIHQEDVPGKVRKLLEDYQLKSERLELEIVEGVLVEDMEATSTKLRDIRDLGVHISIDDYGTGYSSLSYMKSFPVDTLKVDRCFIIDICTDKADRAIVDSTIILAHNLNMAVISEGVEEAEQAELLRDMGCDQMQGYYFSRPLPAKDFAALYAKSQSTEIIPG
ncbi:MAG: bifunctional diguanylate cyclase/phosphodiesterase [Halieaceae bacterium]|nr:bifunctional diguanylate cyclase/phosphodiesterase [Halieaceae bacterium]